MGERKNITWQRDSRMSCWLRFRSFTSLLHSTPRSTIFYPVKNRSFSGNHVCDFHWWHFRLLRGRVDGKSVSHHHDKMNELAHIKCSQHFLLVSLDCSRVQLGNRDSIRHLRIEYQVKGSSIGRRREREWQKLTNCHDKEISVL